MRCGPVAGFAAAGRRGTAGSGACPALVFCGTGRVACGAPVGSQIRALGGAPRQGTGQIRRSGGDGGRVPGGATGRHGPPAKRSLSLAVACRWGQSRRGGGGSRARSASRPGPGGPGPGSRRPQRAAGRRARCQPGQPRQASPLCWRRRSRYRPVATAASPCHCRQHA